MRLSISQLAGPPPAVASYPFRPGDDRGTVEDLYLYLDRPAASPVVLASPTGSSSSGVPSFRFEGAGSTPLFDTADATDYSARPWGGGFELHRWRIGSESLTVLGRVDVVPYAPAGGRLDERAWGRATPSVRALVVNGVEIESGRVVLRPGYNVTAAADAAAGTVTIGAVPGAGAGQYRDCGPGEVLLKTINRAGPTEAGAFALTAADCLSVAAVEAGLTISGDCRPCLDCDDLVRVYKALKQADAAGAELGARYVAAVTRYNEAVTRWNEQKECRESRPVRIAATPYRSAGTTCAVVMVTHGNTKPYCQADVSIVLSWAAPVVGQYVTGSGVVYLPNGQTRTASPFGTWPTYTFAWGSIDPGRSARVKASFCFPGGTPGQTATLTATAVSAGVTVGTETFTVTFS